jgi:hypothetical protein
LGQVWVKGRRCLYSEGTTTPRILNGKMPPQNLPTKLKQIRLKAGLSKTAIIRALNYKAVPLYPSHVSQFERGERKPPLLLIKAYAELGGTCMCVLADDELSLE